MACRSGSIIMGPDDRNPAPAQCVGAQQRPHDLIVNWKACSTTCSNPMPSRITAPTACRWRARAHSQGGDRRHRQPGPHRCRRGRRCRRHPGSSRLLLERRAGPDHRHEAASSQDLLTHDINLFAYHLPLDVHPRWGTTPSLPGCLASRCVAASNPGTARASMVGKLEEPMSGSDFAVDCRASRSRAASLR